MELFFRIEKFALYSSVKECFFAQEQIVSILLSQIRLKFETILLASESFFLYTRR